MILPESITVIGEGAFAYSTLAEIIMPNSIERIEPQAFAGCRNMNAIQLPASLTAIADGLLQNCTGIRELTLPGGVVTVGSLSFAGMTGLTSLTLGEKVTSLGANALAHCSALTAIRLPAPLTTLGDGAPDGCAGLQTITVAAGNTAFAANENVLFSADRRTLLKYAANSARTAYAVPDGVTRIAENAFQGSSRLQRVTLPAALTSLGTACFAECSALRELIFAADCTVDALPSRVLADCPVLSQVTLPNGLRSIGANAFAQDAHLSVLTLPPQISYLQATAFDDCKALILTGEENAYVRAFAENNRLRYIPNGGAMTVTSIELPMSLRMSLGTSQLMRCEVLPAAAADPAVDYFSSAPGIVSVDGRGRMRALAVGSAIVTVSARDGSQVSADCLVVVAPDPVEELKTMTVPSALTELGNEAFCGLAVECIDLSASACRRIGSRAFADCTQLARVLLPASVQEISPDAFEGCAAVVIVCPAGSYAEGFAQTHGMTVQNAGSTTK